MAGQQRKHLRGRRPRPGRGAAASPAGPALSNGVATGESPPSAETGVGLGGAVSSPGSPCEVAGDGVGAVVGVVTGGVVSSGVVVSSGGVSSSRSWSTS